MSDCFTALQLPVYRFVVIFCLMFMVSLPVHTGPKQDQTTLDTYYRQLFPNLKPADYADGVYAIDPVARESWLAIEEFPPYEPAIEAGEKLFNQAFNNQSTYAGCFENQGIGISQNYPKWNTKLRQVQTLATAINACRVKNQEPPLPYQHGQMTQLLAYLAFTSRGNLIDINIPEQDSAALKAYEDGKKYYYQRRGQLNFSCASCHIQNAGKKIRSEMLSPLFGQVTGWPTYRLKWGEMGTLHRRIIGCHKQIRAIPPKAQSPELRNLEYFMTLMSNGLPVNGPSTRK